MAIHSSKPREIVEPAEQTGREHAHLDEWWDGHENSEDLASVRTIERLGLAHSVNMLTWPNVSVNSFSLELYTPISMQATQYMNGMRTKETK